MELDKEAGLLVWAYLIRSWQQLKYDEAICNAWYMQQG